MFLYAPTIFLSAFLLFLVQPLIARIILPWFGGAASVWTTCMMFFQLVLLAGYFYAHGVTRRLSLRRQGQLHIALIVASLALLPILPGPGWKPADSLHPELRILALLAAVVGIPYLLLSTTGPLLQSWYARARPGASPYRLYALSNVGSLLALLGYPAAIEPALRIPWQAYFWSGGYVVFAVLCALTAWRSASSPPPPVLISAEDEQKPLARRMAVWAALAACPSALMVAITSHITQNIAPLPLLWVAPLALYLLSFILTFESDRWYRRVLWFPAFIAAVAVMTGFLFPLESTPEIKLLVPVFIAGFFCCAMMCHGELYRLRPPPQSLTYFYLMISVGGAIGGLFVGIFAPTFFDNYYELPIALLATVIFVALVFQKGDPVLPGPTAKVVQWGLFAALALGLIYLSGYEMPRWGRQFKLMARNFYGVLRVQDNRETATTAWTRDLNHGTINHGAEFMEVTRRRVPTTYYGHISGVGIALDSMPSAPRRIGVIGLGAGTLAAYCRPGDTFHFYEINPIVPVIARDEFFFLKECPGAVSIALGDARLTLEREPPQNFDVLAVDAFSGDSIPVHLLTIEAVREELRHVKPDGLLMMHVSNKFLDLEKVVARAAEELHLTTAQISNEEDEQNAVYRSDWIALSRVSGAFDKPEWKIPARSGIKSGGIRLWTDDYGSVLSILK